MELFFAVGRAGLLLELLFVVETPSTQNLGLDRFIPNTPIRLVVNHAGKDVTEDYNEQLLNKKLIRAQISTLLENEA